ncbi:MAG: hypothetical protein Q8L79_05110 [Methylobacter sp.]|uniref:hypothetical protein n=1 Tax=Methylobacter sp. TaxID=2051955 RepID=UPI002730FF47|nr:hypothetical protein [Methylobacter sp.]MDP1664489.1 hypothetical protein [Methylobacter sp.]
MTEQKRGGRRQGAGRKKGTKNKVTVDLKNKAAEYTEEAIQVFVEIMRDSEAPAATRLQAADKILDRGYGRPAVHIEAQHSAKMDPELMQKLETEFVDRMANARERQRQVLIERGLLDE